MYQPPVDKCLENAVLACHDDWQSKQLSQSSNQPTQKGQQKSYFLSNEKLKSHVCVYICVCVYDKNQRKAAIPSPMWNWLESCACVCMCVCVCVCE